MSEQIFYFIIGFLFAFLIFLLFRDLFIKRIFTHFVGVKATTSEDIEMVDKEINKLLQLATSIIDTIDAFITDLKDSDFEDPELEETLSLLKDDLTRKVNVINMSMGNYDSVDNLK